MSAQIRVYFQWDSKASYPVFDDKSGSFVFWEDNSLTQFEKVIRWDYFYIINLLGSGNRPAMFPKCTATLRSLSLVVVRYGQNKQYIFSTILFFA